MHIAAMTFVALLGAAYSYAEKPIEFNRDIRPILSDRCFVCHGPDAADRQADLRLDTFKGATEWAIDPGDADASTLVERITSTDPDLVMPPPSTKRPPLTAKQIAIIKQWIAEGAKYQDHWSYNTLVKSDLPSTKNKDWSINEIDSFLLARMEAEGVEPSPVADRVTLLRRVTFDLTGLPPTRKEVEDFIADKSPDAYEKVVDRLLASPRYGERMATWWFDLVRFADTVGYHGDQVHRVTPYRDYVLKSFNENLPFDQFTIEQLAGDLLPNPTKWQIVATCYNRLLQTSHEGGIQDKEYLAIHQADRVRNFAEVWLGASMGCAQCHDHKFDPISTRDFYSVGALFADVDHYGSFVQVARNTNPTERPPEMLAPTLPVYEKLKPIEVRIAELEKGLIGRIPRDYQKQLAELTELRKQKADLQGQFVRVMVTDALDEPRVVKILTRGDWMDESGDIVQPAIPEFLGKLDVKGRRANRLDLARWVVSDSNPLTSRVIANRLWALFFTRGLSANQIELGSQGDWPDHPELLDWLAVDFREGGWDVKKLVRKMVTSQAYRQSSLPRADLVAVDPNNVLLARQNRHRLDAEMIRDQALQVSGLLENQLGGVVGKPYQPAGYFFHLNFPRRTYQAATDADQYRRGVYTHWQRQYLHPFLKAFDAPSREECTAGRPESNTPLASLALLNDPSFVEAARALAQRSLLESTGDDTARLKWLWQQVQCRDARDNEIATLQRVLADHRGFYKSQPDEAAKLLAVGLSPRDEKLDPAEHASWTAVCRVLLNLSETITSF